MSYEDFTTWDENDPSGDLTVAANEITVTTEANYTACVDKFYGTNYFNGPFVHYIDFQVDSLTDNSAAPGIWAISNTDDLSTPVSGSLDIDIYGSSTSAKLYLDTTSTYRSSTMNIVMGTRYYLKLERDASNNVSCKIYSDAAHTTLLETVGSFVFSSACSYISVGWNGSGAGTWSGSIGNLDIGAAAAGNPWHAYAQQ